MRERLVYHLFNISDKLMEFAASVYGWLSSSLAIWVVLLIGLRPDKPLLWIVMLVLALMVGWPVTIVYFAVAAIIRGIGNLIENPSSIIGKIVLSIIAGLVFIGIGLLIVGLTGGIRD